MIFPDGEAGGRGQVRGIPHGEFAADIMVVDDQPANLKLMESLLRCQGYGVRSFPRGRMALVSAEQQPPDLILLDINMPEMTGYEVCQQLKKNPKLSAIPVIFLSALKDTEDKVKALRAGGVDYIAKPFEIEEVHARVDTHLRLHRLQRELRMHTDHLEDLVAVRTRELAESQERLQVLDRAKSDFLRLISHEFRTPLNGLFGVGELLLGDLTNNPEDGELRDMFQQSQRRIMSILDDALLLTEIDVGGERFAPQAVGWNSVISSAVDRATEYAKSRQVGIELMPAEVGWVYGEEKLLVKAIQGLLETGAKFSTKGRVIRLKPSLIDDEASTLVIETTGRTIPADVMPRLFDVFSIAEAITPEGNLGLGLPVAHRIMLLFGGSVTVANQETDGIRIVASFKRALPGKASKGKDPNAPAGTLPEEDAA